MMALTRSEQIEHLNEPGNRELFEKNQGNNVRDYFADYYEEYEQDNGRPGDALYMCVCADLGITPKKGGRYDQERGARKMKAVDMALTAIGKNNGLSDVLKALYARAYEDAVEDAKRVQR